MVELTRDDTIFKDQDVLRDSYQPTNIDDIIERDEEIEEYVSGFQPVIDGKQPYNIFVYGQTGVGKTLSTNLIIDYLNDRQQDYDDLEVLTPQISCKSLTSSYQVSIRLVNYFRDQEDELPTRGHDSGYIYEQLWAHLNDVEASHVIFVLDEIDSIGTDDDLLYQLPRCNDLGHVTETNVGVVGISNDFTFRDNLSAQVKDSLCDYEVHYPPYNAQELQNILQQRAEKAFYEGVLTEGVISLASAFAGQDSGSARQALRILHKAGDLARRDGRDQVTEQDVRDANTLIEKGRLLDEFRRLPTQSRLTLQSVLLLADEGETPSKRSEVYATYESLVSDVGSSKKSTRTIHNHLSQLSLKGFLTVEQKNKGSHGGSYFEYDVNQFETLEEALDDSDLV